NCGTCVGGNTGLAPCTQDCNGVWGGSATTDNCGNCVGGDTGQTPCDEDLCDGFDIEVTNSVEPSCHGESNGEITVSAGSNAAISYNWNHGANGAAISGLSAGTYTVTATDNEIGCSATLAVMLGQPNEITINDMQTVNPSCAGSEDGKVSVVAAGGSGNLTYTWSGPVNLQGPTHVDIPAGEYTLTVTDANGCSISQTVELIEPDALEVDLVITDAGCHGIEIGSAIVMVTGGTGNYAVNWSVTGNMNQFGLFDLGVGNYGVLVADQNGCVFVDHFDIGIDCPYSAELEEGIIDEDEDETVLPTQPENDVTDHLAEDTPSHLAVYPNPNNGEYVFLDLQQKSSAEPTVFSMVQIHNMAGQLISSYSINMNEGQFEGVINFEKTLPFGVYLMSVYTQDEVLTQKIVVK
ncbi:MAG: T9SS C-terminal target domain-containing protein, partial [Cryomorphaceae bacterium]